MKKVTLLSLLLSAALLLQCVSIPVSAMPVPVTTPVETTMETVPGDLLSTLPPAEEEIPFGQLSIVSGCRTVDGMKPLGGSDRRLATAQAAMIYEVKTGTVIYGYNPDTKIVPGSLAKIVTALVTIELCEMDEQVTVNSTNISRLPPGSKNKNLKHDEVLSVEDLLHCLMLESANDAAIALAEHVSGNQQGFLVLMNERVREMGCTNTEFGNVHGLSNATSYTTARDMVKIVMEACKNEEFSRIFGTAKYTVPETNRSEARNLVTTNYLIDQSIIPQFYDTHVKGGKEHAEGTFTSMVCRAEYGDMNLICVVLGATRVFAENGWSAISYGNFNEMNDLLEYASSSYKVNQILYDGQSLTQFSVIDGESDVVGQPRVNYNTVLPINCNMDNLYMSYSVVDGSLTAPVKEGEMIATVAIKYLNSCVAEAELYAMNSVVRNDDSQVSVRTSAVSTDNDMDGFLGFLGAMAVIMVGVFGIYLAYNAYRRARRRIQRRRRRASRRRSY